MSASSFGQNLQTSSLILYYIWLLVGQVCDDTNFIYLWNLSPPGYIYACISDVARRGSQMMHATWLVNYYFLLLFYWISCWQFSARCVFWVGRNMCFRLVCIYICVYMYVSEGALVSRWMDRSIVQMLCTSSKQLQQSCAAPELNSTNLYPIYICHIGRVDVRQQHSLIDRKDFGASGAHKRDVGQSDVLFLSLSALALYVVKDKLQKCWEAARLQRQSYIYIITTPSHQFSMLLVSIYLELVYD